MSWYKEHKQEWKEIIETISREVNRTPQMIEKNVKDGRCRYLLSGRRRE